jgi:uncharacterized protein
MSESPSPATSPTTVIPLFPLGTVLFPDGLLPLKIFEQRYVDMIKNCLRDTTPFGVCLIKEGQEVGNPAAPYNTGCLARIEQWEVPHPNLFAVLARGSSRFRILDTTIAANGLITARIETLPEPTRPDTIDQACQEVLRQAVERAGAAGGMPGPVRLDDPVWVSYRLSEILPISAQEKQTLLELSDTEARLTQLRELMLAHGIIESINKIN